MNKHIVTTGNFMGVELQLHKVLEESSRLNAAGLYRTYGIEHNYL